MNISFYKANKSPVVEFIKSLDAKDRAIVLACLKSVEELGLDSPRVAFRQIKGKLWEIKIKATATGYRIFYVVVQKNSLVLLHAYKKKTQKTPIKELVVAEKRMLEVMTHESTYIN